jgi:hypothetical protein
MNAKTVRTVRAGVMIVVQMPNVQIKQGISNVPVIQGTQAMVLIALISTNVLVKSMDVIRIQYVMTTKEVTSVFVNKAFKGMVKHVKI